MNRALSILVLLNGPSIVWQPIRVVAPLDETRSREHSSVRRQGWKGRVEC